MIFEIVDPLRRIDLVCTQDLRGRDYQGMRAKTKSGRVCQRWDQYLPSFLELYTDANFPNDASIHAAENYCRSG
jgi:hypothetical protein